MSSRKLRVLRYKKQLVDYNNDDEFISFLCDMDEMYLKTKSEDWLAALLDEKNDGKQKEMIEEYLSDLKLDPNSSRKEIANSIADLAIDTIYQKNGEAQKFTAEVLLQKQKQLAEQQKEANPLSGIDYDSPEFEHLVDQLCQVVKIAPHPDPKIRLKAACLFIQQNLPREIIEHRNGTFTTKKFFDLDSIPLGYPSSADEALDGVAKILRMLNIASLRNTQTLINETLVGIQNLTIDKDKKPNLKQVMYGKS